MENLSIGIIAMAGLAILGGTLGASLFKKVKIPQVVGYIVAGLLIGQSGLKLVTIEDVNNLEPFNMLALAVIGFLVGSEIHLDTFKKYGKQFSAILLLEGVLAFVLAGLATGIVLFTVSGNITVAIAGGVVFGAIASATDPAATMSVLWEYRTAGIFTTTLIAIIALDDALAMALYGIGSGVSQILAGSGDSSAVAMELVRILLELVGSLAIGAVTGELLTRLFRRSKQYESSVATASGLLLFMVGLGITLNLDIILMAMSAGILFYNRIPHRSKRFIEYIHSLSTPIYVFFFVLIGARITLGAMPGWIWAIVGLYVLTRSVGKFLGAYVGSRYSKAAPVVQNNVGLGLFAQGGVAIGLSIMAAHHLDAIHVTDTLTLGDTIISAVAATTLFAQLLGPAAVKVAAIRSGEAGKDINEDDLISDKRVDNYILETPVVLETTPATEVISLYSTGESETLPVIDSEQKLLGVIGMKELRAILGDSSVLPFILASDIMNLDFISLNKEETLEKGLTLTEQTQVDEFPVLEGERYCGTFNSRNARHLIRQELISMKGDSYAA